MCPTKPPTEGTCKLDLLLPWNFIELNFIDFREFLTCLGTPWKYIFYKAISLRSKRSRAEFVEKVGTRANKRNGGGGIWEREGKPSPSSLFFCSRFNFRVIIRLETFSTQAIKQCTCFSSATNKTAVLQ